MIRQCVGGDVVRLDERGIKQVPQRNRIAGLKSYVVLTNTGKGLRRNRDNFVKVTRFMFRPIERYDRRGDLGQAANLAPLSGILLLQNVASLRIDDHKGLFGRSQTDAAPEREEPG